MKLNHPYVRKIVLSMGDKARRKFEGDKLRFILFELAGWYGCSELYGLWAMFKMLYHLRVKPLLFKRKK